MDRPHLKRWLLLVGFGLSYSFASVPAFLSIIGTQGMTARDSTPSSIFLIFICGWGGLYALCGGFPYLISAAGWKKAVSALVGFGAAGATCGGFVVLALISHEMDGVMRRIAPAGGIFLFVLPFTVPWLLGRVVATWIERIGRP